VLGITQQPGKSVSESVAAALEGRVRLLVFDNCEHVVDTVADLVEAILAASATVKILATSREGLGVNEEHGALRRRRRAADLRKSGIRVRRGVNYLDFSKTRYCP
jgi:predicted ATPase